MRCGGRWKKKRLGNSGSTSRVRAYGVHDISTTRLMRPSANGHSTAPINRRIAASCRAMVPPEGGCEQWRCERRKCPRPRSSLKPDRLLPRPSLRGCEHIAGFQNDWRGRRGHIPTKSTRLAWNLQSPRCFPIHVQADCWVRHPKGYTAMMTFP